MDDAPYADVALPEAIRPSMPALNESYSVAQFYVLNDSRTGVLALGSFSARNFTLFQGSLLDGLVALKARNATNLIVDVVSGLSRVKRIHVAHDCPFVSRPTTAEVSMGSPTLHDVLLTIVRRIHLHRACEPSPSYLRRRLTSSIAQWLHRIVRRASLYPRYSTSRSMLFQIVGPKRTSEPQAGLDTTTRAGPLAQLIVRRIAEGADPEVGSVLVYRAPRGMKRRLPLMPRAGTAPVQPGPMAECDAPAVSRGVRLVGAGEGRHQWARRRVQSEVRAAPSVVVY